VYPNVSTPTTTLYLDPLYITATSAGQTFKVNITVVNVTSLLSWDLAIEWDPTILNCTDFEEGPFLSDAGPTWEFPGTIDNVAGRIDPYWGVSQAPGATYGVNGTGTLAIATFKSKQAGVTAPHLLLGGVSNLIEYPSYNNIYPKVIDVFPVVEGLDVYYVGMVRGNSTIANFAFNQSQKEISFNVTGEDNTLGFSNVTIPKTLMTPEANEEWIVLMNGTEVTPPITENATHTSIYLAYSHSTHKIEIRVSQSPYGPTADFTYLPLLPLTEETITFNASSSLPGWNGIEESPIVNYSWDFGDSNITETSNPIITHNYTEADTYTVTLNVTDAQGFWNITSKQITVSLLTWGPTASFEYSPALPLVDQTVTFNASESLPGWNGTAVSPIVSYAWDFDDGNTTTTSTPIITYSYTTENTYTVVLNVTDDQGLWNTTSKTITVIVIYGPTANFTYSPSVPCRDQTVTFNASSSLPGWNGTHIKPIVNYTWDFGDSTPIVTEADPIITHSYTTADTYTVILNVTDSQDLWNTTSKLIIVLEPYGPVANFTYSPPSPVVNRTVTFDASTSSPGWNGTIQPIVSYEWDFDDGTNATTSNPIITHNYTQADTLAVTLNVTDAQGFWNITSKQITVRETVHDVAVTSVTRVAASYYDADYAYPNWHGVPAGRTRKPYSINVTVANLGDFVETFNVTVWYENATESGIIAIQLGITLAPGTSTTLTYNWNLAAPVGGLVGDWTIKANVTIVLDDLPSNNENTDGNVILKWMADTDGTIRLSPNKLRIDIVDVGPLVVAWKKTPGEAGWDPRCDYNMDGEIDTWDVSFLVIYWYTVYELS